MADNGNVLVRFACGKKINIDSATSVDGKLYVATDTQELFFTPIGSANKIKIGDIIETDDLSTILAPIANKFYYMENTLYRNINGEWKPVGSDVFLTIEEYEKDAKVISAALNDLNDRVIQNDEDIASANESIVTINEKIDNLEISFEETDTTSVERDTESGDYSVNVKISEETEEYLSVNENGGLQVTGLDDLFEVIATSLNDLNDRVIQNADDIANIDTDVNFEDSDTVSFDVDEENRTYSANVKISEDTEEYLSVNENGGLQVTGLEEQFEVIATSLNDLNERVIQNAEAIENIDIDFEETDTVSVEKDEETGTYSVNVKISEDTEDFLSVNEEGGLQVTGLDEKFEVIATSLNNLNDRVIQNAEDIANVNVNISEESEEYLTKDDDGALKIEGLDDQFEVIATVLNYLNDKVEKNAEELDKININETATTIVEEDLETRTFSIEVKIAEDTEEYLSVNEEGGLQVTGLNEKFQVIAEIANDLNERVKQNTKDIENVNVDISEESEEYLTKDDEGALKIEGLDDLFEVIATSLNDLNDRVRQNTEAIENLDIDVNFEETDTASVEKDEETGAYSVDVKISEDTEDYLSVNENGGLQVTGIDEQFTVIATSLCDLNDRVIQNTEDIANINVNISEESEKYLTKDDDGALKIEGIDDQFEVVAASLNDLNRRAVEMSDIQISSTSDSYLTKQADGIKLSGVSEEFARINALIGNIQTVLDTLIGNNS